MNLSFPEIDALTEQMDGESKAIKQELYKFCWYLRGGLTVEQAYNLSFEDREIISSIVEDNLEVTKRSGLNFF